MADQDNSLEGGEGGSTVKWPMALSNLLTEGRKETFYLMTHSTHFIYGYMASDIW